MEKIRPPQQIRSLSVDPCLNTLKTLVFKQSFLSLNKIDGLMACLRNKLCSKRDGSILFKPGIDLFYIRECNDGLLNTVKKMLMLSGPF